MTYKRTGFRRNTSQRPFAKATRHHFLEKAGGTTCPSITRRQDISTPERECTGGKELRCCHWWEGDQCETSPSLREVGVSACYSGVEFLAGRWSGRCLMYQAGAQMVTALRYGPRGGGGGALHRRRVRWVRLLDINGLRTGAARLEVGTRLAPPATHCRWWGYHRIPSSIQPIGKLMNSILSSSPCRILASCFDLSSS